MTSEAEARTRREEESERVEAFVDRFFGEGNDADGWGDLIRPFLDNLRLGTDAPIVLPRYLANTDNFSMYVIARSPAHTAQVRELIGAFSGPTYSTGGDVLPAALDSQDPIDAAVIDFAGPNTTFVVRTSSNRVHRANLRSSLELMQSTLARKPTRSWSVVRPLGRLIAEFEGALASGGEASSRWALEQITARGGISATNLAHLRIKRFDRLGLSRDLLGLSGLNNVLRQDPPLPVKEAVLNAVHSTSLAEPLSQGDLQGACDRLREVGLPLPTGGDPHLYGDEAVTVLLTAAVGRGDGPHVASILSKLRQHHRVGSVPDALWQAASALIASTSEHPPARFKTDRPPTDGAVTPEATAAESSDEPGDDFGAEDIRPPESWLDLFTRLGHERPDPVTMIRSDAWRTWPSPTESDTELAQTLSSFDDPTWGRAWMTVGAIIDALGYGDPAPAVVREFITYALTFEKFSSGDLVTLHALTEIYLRSAPSAAAYRSLLEELRDSCAQWVSPENVVAALDLADRLVLAPCPDENARLSLAVALLTPLHRYQGRLDDAVLPFARQLSSELNVPLEWVRERSADHETALDGLSGRSVLLYSLDEAVLARTSAELKRRIPALKVVLAHEKVASVRLKRQTRNADVVVLATRCAKHAATGFITENAKGAKITYADGGGSASLLRAAMSGLLAEQADR